MSQNSVCVCMFGIITALILPGSLRAQHVVEWKSEEGIKRLSRSQYKGDFFHLANQFQAQTNSIECGPTTIAIVLNALYQQSSDDNRPAAPLAIDNMDHVRIRRYTPESVFTASVSSIKSRKRVFGKTHLMTVVNENNKRVQSEGRDYGLQLDQLHRFFGALGSDSSKLVVKKMPSREERKKIVLDIRSSLDRPREFVVVNYLRRAPKIGQRGGGHISPLVAYDEKSNSFLVMDVNPSAGPWVWITADALIEAMGTFDTVENRGYLLVSLSD